MKKIEFRSNRYVFEGGGVIIKKCTNILIKKKTYSKMNYSVVQFTFFVSRYVGYTFYGQQFYTINTAKE